MKNMKTAETIATVANALELGSAIIGEVVGGDAADTLAKQPLTRGILQQQLVTVISNRLASKLGNKA